MSNTEIHLDIYLDRYELHLESGVAVYIQGSQNDKTRVRYEKIRRELSTGYLDKKYSEVKDADLSSLDTQYQVLLKNLVEGITSEFGRALVGLTCLQLTIKNIAPEQSIRLHKGNSNSKRFSWKDGISMRSLDKNFNTPFLRKYGLLQINNDGVFMTRTLAENYPYSRLYKAEIRGPFSQWMAIVDAVEKNVFDPNLGLLYLFSLLKNKSEIFNEESKKACNMLDNLQRCQFEDIKNLISQFYNSTHYSARAFEVAIHAFYQALNEMNLLDMTLIPLSQMRSANKKHGNIGDIELAEDGTIVIAWDAKYGKPYLRDELEELRDKLIIHKDVQQAGFLCNDSVDLRKDIVNRKNEIELELGVNIKLSSFDDFVTDYIKEMNSSQKNELAFKWIKALVESFAQRRIELAPIDEPCDAWIKDLITILAKFEREQSLLDG